MWWSRIYCPKIEHHCVKTIMFIQFLNSNLCKKVAVNDFFYKDVSCLSSAECHTDVCQNVLSMLLYNTDVLLLLCYDLLLVSGAVSCSIS